MKKLFLPILTFFIFILCHNALAHNLTEESERKSQEEACQKNEKELLVEAKKFIEDMGAKAIKTLTTKKDKPLEQKKEFEKIFINHFAVKNIATFVLGIHANPKRTSVEDKKEFFKLFKKSIADIYTERFKNYTNESFKVTRATESSGKSGIIRVFSEVSRDGASPIDVEWKIFKSYKDDACSFSIADVIVEGFSMSTTQRSEYNAIINREGSVAGLNRVLEKKLSEHES